MSEPLRVAFDARDALAADARGWGRYARELLAALRAGAGGALALAALRDGGLASRLPEAAWEQLVLPAQLARGRAAVVHAPSCFLPLARPCAGVVTVHDLAFEAFPEDFAPRTRAKFAWVTPRAARSAERVVCVSAFTRDDLCERYGIDPVKVRVVHNAPALPVGSAPAPADGDYVLGVGDLRAKKNWGRLVSAVRALRASGQPSLRLVLAGRDAGEADALRALAGPGGWLELRGYVPDAEVDALMRGAAALCHPSLYEGFGLVVVEAQARGVPVACSATTSLPEAAGGAAELFDPLDVDAIADAVSRALGSRERLAEAGRARAASLSWSASAAATAAAYHEAVAERSA